MAAQVEHAIVNDLGLHARAASKLVALANRYDADVYIGCGGREVNAKSILGVLMLAAAQGTEIRVRCDGADEEAACKALGELIDGGFGEL